MTPSPRPAMRTISSAIGQRDRLTQWAKKIVGDHPRPGDLGRAPVQPHAGAGGAKPSRPSGAATSVSGPLCTTTAPERRAALSAGAVEHASRFGWAATADGMLSVYADAMREYAADEH